MLCTNCKHAQASVFIEDSRGKERLSLCEACAKLAGHDMLPPLEMENTRISEGAEAFSHIRGDFENDSKSCPLCSSTLLGIASSGAAGCPLCYKVFEGELSPMITYIHGSAHHTGRTPKKFAEDVVRKRRLAQLRAELSGAIAKEDFEKCVTLRDEIKELSRKDDE